ncbi:MAG TPA: hypothetical protein VF767_03130 [Bryobacteraceae bacterium]
MAEEIKDTLRENLSTADLANSGRPAGATSYPEQMRGAGGTAMAPEQSTPLFAAHEAQDLRSRWSDIQAGFVDEPRKAVEQADGLVAAAIKRLAEVFAEERSKLEAQWDRGDNISTEDLRVALQRYRSFFTRLLSV